MIVADVNLIVYLLTDTPQREQAVALYQEDSDWRLPPLWRHELLNVLATLTRQTVITGEQAVTLWHNALGLFAGREQDPDMDRSLRLAIEHRISAYDAQYVALAEALECLLVTADKRLRRKFPECSRGLG